MLQQQSENINELAASLCKFQGEVGLVAKNAKVRIPTKSGRNIEFAYADLEEIRKTIKKPMAENGLSFVQIISSFEDRQFLVTMLMHTSGQWIKSSIKMKDAQDIKELGATITYLKRYSLSSLLGLVADDDLDAIADEIVEPKISKHELDKLTDLIGDDEALFYRILTAVRSETENNEATLGDMPKKRYGAFLKSINKAKEISNGNN